MIPFAAASAAAIFFLKIRYRWRMISAVVYGGGMPPPYVEMMAMGGWR